MLTSKMERFAQAIASGMTQADAYRTAYNAAGMKPAVVQNKASLLMKRDGIRVRVEQLRRPVVEAMQYGLMEAMHEAQEAFAVSKRKDNGAAMVAAVTLRARLNGLMVERKEIVLTEVQRLDDESLDRLIALKAIEAGIAQAVPRGADLH